MSADPVRPVTVERWQLVKRTDAGEPFEVIEGSGDGPAVVVFRREGLAPSDAYATGLPVALKEESEWL